MAFDWNSGTPVDQNSQGSGGFDWNKGTPVDTPAAPAQSMSQRVSSQMRGWAPSLSESIWSSMANDVGSASRDVNSAITGTDQYQGQGALQRGFSAASSAASAIPNIAADLIPGGKSVLGALGSVTSAGINAAGNIGNTLGAAASHIPGVKFNQNQYDTNNAAFANSGAGKAVETGASIAQSSGNIAGTILAANGAASSLQKGVDFVKKIQTANQVGNAFKPTATDEALKQTTDAWKKPSETPTASFTKARAVLSKSPDTPQFLAEQGLDPSTHIEGGKYSTAETAQSLRDTAGKMSADTLRPSLQMADYSTPKTPVEDIVREAIRQAKDMPGITPGNLETISRNIQNEASSLSKQFPEGMSLTDMHDYKITYSQNAGYSPINDPAVNNSAIANRSVGGALGRMVESKAPSSIPVGEFNDYLSRYYRAADYLDELNTKTAPVSLTQKVARTAGKLVGAHIGGLFGGGLVSEFAGYQLGNALVHALENLPNAARAQYISNLEMTNPEAFTRVQEYLQNANAGNTGMLALPPAGPETPIPLGHTPEPQTVAPYAAKNPLPSADPKTGRMIRVYNSSIK